MQRYRPREVIVERGSEGSVVFDNLRKALPDVPFSVVDHPEEYAKLNRSSDPLTHGKRHLVLMRHKGNFLKKCPGSDGQVCCNYFVINFASNCPMDCTYCYLQDYLAENPSLKVFSNVDDLLRESAELLGRHREFLFRIGTGEITDSLALDSLIGFAAETVPFFAEQRNVLLELKTKSDCVEGLLGLDPKDRVVVSWSMNPQRVIDADESQTASFEQRLAAAVRCQDAGYKLGFHFDPMVEYPGWETDYRAMVESIFARIDAKRVSWLSLGVLRTTPSLKRIMRSRFPATRILSGEQILCPDGKMRYFQPLRVRMYRKMLEWIRSASPIVFVYLCMETKEVWDQVFGFSPSCEKELGSQMTRGLRD
jgi:spore photoproduct lyase